MKIEDNHYTYRIETKDSNGGSLDFIDIDTVEPLRCAYDVQDELNLETNEHIKRVEEVVLDANSTEFWYVDEVRTSDTHLVCYFEEVELMASKDHPMVDTNRSVFEYGKINSNEHQNTNFICTHVMDNGVSRVYMSIDKTIFEFATFNNETIKHFISNNPVTVWYALRHEVIIPRSMSKGHLLTLSGQTDITLTTTSEQAKLPIMKFNIGDKQYTLDGNPIHINNTQEGTQIRNIVLEGNTPINYARGNGVNTTEQVSNTRYDFTPFYDGQATIQGTVEGGYVSAKLYGDTMVNIAKLYGETPLLTATNESTLCDDLLGTNEEGIVLADGEITEGRIYGDSSVVDNTIQSVINPAVTFANIDSSLSSQATFPYTLNKLPNGVADYIDVVNKVHVQRVGVFVADGSETYSFIKYNSDLMTIGFGRSVSDNKNSIAEQGFISDKLPFNENCYGDMTVGCVAIGGSVPYRTYCVIDATPLETKDLSGLQTYLSSNPITVLYELATPIYTPLTEEEIVQLPLSAYADGYVNLSSDQLMPSFEFRMKASNRYQVDMLETGYYYLDAPVGNVKLGTANVDVQQMPCIVKVDNVGTGDSGYRLGFNDESEKTIHIIDPSGSYGYWIDDNTGELNVSSNSEKQFLSDFIEINTSVSSIVLVDDGLNKDISFWDENKAFVKRSVTHNNRGIFKVSLPNTPFKFIRIGSSDASDLKAKAIINPITLAKLPSHRIPTSFTQGMKCGTDFGYWEGIKESAWRGIRLTGEGDGDGSLRSADNAIRYLNRIEGDYQGNVIVEDEFDFGTGKLTKRVGKIVLDDTTSIYDVRSVGKEYTCITIFGDKMGIKFNNSFGNYGFAMSATVPFGVNYGGEYNHMYTGGNNLMIIMKTNELGTPTKEGILKYFEANPMTVYYELTVPEISYVDVLSHEGKTANNATVLYTLYYILQSNLQPQVKPSHLTYPVPSLVGNRTYTVVHNRKNITGSTKPIELNLGGTVVQLNDASSKTLVKTPSTLAHSNLIFIGGESTVDHVMVLDGDWTNKPIEYFENMKGHDTDAIITIIGDGKIDDVAEQYLW